MEKSVCASRCVGRDVPAAETCVCRALEELRGVLRSAEDALDGACGLILGGGRGPRAEMDAAPADGILEDLVQLIERARAVDKLAGAIRGALVG